MKNILIFCLCFFPFTILGASTFRVGFFPDNIFQSRPENSGLFQKLLFFKQVGQTLVESGPSDELFPGIAESWKISADKKTYIFTLRKNIKFHDGSLLTARDVVLSLNSVIYSNKNTLHLYLKNIKGLSDGWQKRNCSGIQVLSSDQIVIHLVRPYPLLLKILSSGMTSIFKNENSKLIGTGPYMVIDSKDGKFLRAYADYQGSYKAQIKEIQIVESSDFLYGKKNVPDSFLPDFDANVPPGLQKRYTDKNYTITRSPNLGTIGFYPNLNSKNITSRKQRIALLGLLYKVSKKMNHYLSDKILGSFVSDVLPRGMYGYNPNRISWLELEKELQNVDTSYLPKNITLATVGQIFGNSQYFLEEIKKISKIKLTIVYLDSTNIINEIERKNFDVVYLTWHSAISDPQSPLIIFDLIKTFDKKNKEILKLMENAVSTSEEIERMKLYSLIIDCIFKNGFFLPIYQKDYVSALKNGYTMSSFYYRYQPMLSEIKVK